MMIIIVRLNQGCSAAFSKNNRGATKNSENGSTLTDVYFAKDISGKMLVVYRCRKRVLGETLTKTNIFDGVAGTLSLPDM